jgi:predicted nuclease of predicted toxin-antitoxin system
VSVLSNETQDIVSRGRSELSPDADDNAIADYAPRNCWVVLTSDGDFFGEETNYGLLTTTTIKSVSRRRENSVR